MGSSGHILWLHQQRIDEWKSKADTAAINRHLETKVDVLSHAEAKDETSNNKKKWHLS